MKFYFKLSYFKITVLLFLAVIFCAFCFAQTKSFIKKVNTHFEYNGKPYYFIGTNMWYANLLAMPSPDGINKKRLLKELDFLQQQGVLNIRVLVGSQSNGKIINGVIPVHPSIQTDTAQYNNDVLSGMDYLLQQLEKRNISAVFFFGNNWEWSGGFLQYLNWHSKINDTTLAKKYSWDEYRDYVSQFYSCTACKEDFWNFIKLVLQRTNKLTGRKYRNEPTIMAWEIANEPRPMRAEAINDYKTFLQQTSALIKKADPNHLVTLGTEGYMGTENLELFKTIHSDKNIDYATIHIWPKNWSWYKDSTFKSDFKNVLQKTDTYITDHDKAMISINKPLVVEEFGMARDDFSFALTSSTIYRDEYFDLIFNKLITSKKSNTSIAGLNFWAYGGFGKPSKNITPFWKEGDDLLGDPPMEEQGLNAVFASDSSTWKLIRKYTSLLKK